MCVTARTSRLCGRADVGAVLAVGIALDDLIRSSTRECGGFIGCTAFFDISAIDRCCGFGGTGFAGSFLTDAIGWASTILCAVSAVFALRSIALSVSAALWGGFFADACLTFFPAWTCAIARAVGAILTVSADLVTAPGSGILAEVVDALTPVCASAILRASRAIFTKCAFASAVSAVLRCAVGCADPCTRHKRTAGFAACAGGLCIAAAKVSAALCGDIACAT